MANAKPSGRIIKDRFTPRDNAYHIIQNLPPDEDSSSGWALAWISPRMSNGGLGWRNWIPLEYGDKHTGKDGELLKPYISDVPLRMQGPDRIDNWVRRGDSVLCRKQADEVGSERQYAADLSQARIAELTVPEGQKILPHVTTIGGGLQREANPKFDQDTSGALAKKLR